MFNVKESKGNLQHETMQKHLYSVSNIEKRLARMNAYIIIYDNVELPRNY